MLKSWAIKQLRRLVRISVTHIGLSVAISLRLLIYFCRKLIKFTFRSPYTHVTPRQTAHGIGGFVAITFFQLGYLDNTTVPLS